MCDTLTMNKVQETVQDFLGKGCMFTAFEISIAVKEKCKADNMPIPRHGHIKNDIHQELQPYISQGVLERELCDVGAPEMAFVYFHPGQDVSNYVPMGRNDKPASVPALPSSGISSAPPLPSSGISSGAVKKGHEPDARGTLCVPCGLLTATGLAPGNVAYVSASNRDNKPVLEICKTSPATPLTSYTVDCYGNVRVTNIILSKAGIGGDFYQFDHVDDKVIVSLCD